MQKCNLKDGFLFCKIHSKTPLLSINQLSVNLIDHWMCVKDSIFDYLLYSNDPNV